MDKKNLKYLPGLLVVAVLWFGLFFWNIVKPQDEFSDSERRPLASFPTLSFDSIKEGDFEKFDKDFATFRTSFEKNYALDQFPMRESFRTLKAICSLYVFGKKETNDIYIVNGYASQMYPSLNEASVEKAIEKFNYLYKTYVADTDAKVYLSVVPDKNFFMAKENGYLSIDYEKLFDMMKTGMDYATYIDITDTLSLKDFYKTDTHWRQERIAPVSEKILTSMGKTAFSEYEVVKTDVPFYGVLHGQASLPLPSEEISYITNDVLENCTVRLDYGDPKLDKTYTGVVELEKLAGKDPYEVFLSGAVPVVTIENPAAETDESLIVFRDSFGSSFAPLLVKDYSKVTLVDTRYITPVFVGSFADFENADDVLFMYSAVILNQSSSLK